MADINDLNFPNEMIVSILSRLRQPDLVNASDVCVRWQDLIDKAIGFILYVAEVSPDISEFDKESWVHEKEIEAIAEYGANECYLASITHSESDVTGFPSFKHPRLLKSLWLDTPLLAPTSFINLVTPLKNLRKLTFHASTLSTLRLKGITLEFDLLRALTFSVFTVQGVNHYDEDRMLENSKYVLQNATFKSLALLAIHVPFHPVMAKEVAEAGRDFLIRHKRTLRKVIFSFEESEEDQTGLPAPAPSEVPPKTVAQKDIDGFRLTSFTLHSARPGGGQMVGLRAIMERQLYLGNLHATTDYEPFVKFGSTITACSRTLTQVQMAIRPNDIGGAVFSLQAFESCKHLKVLALLGPPKVNDNPDVFDEHEDDIDGRLLTQDISGASYLPKRLEVVKIFNLYMKTNETKAILSLPALRVIRFKNIGRYAELGMDIKDALAIFQRKPPLRSISCSEYINVKSVPTQVNETDNSILFSAMLIRQIEGATFNAHLSECGTHHLPGVHPSEPEVLPGFSDEFVIDEEIFPMEEDDDEEGGDVGEDVDEEENEEEADEAEAEEEEGDIDQPDDLDDILNVEDFAVVAGAALAAAAVAEAVVPPNMFFNLVDEEETEEDTEYEDEESMEVDEAEDEIEVDDDVHDHDFNEEENF